MKNPKISVDEIRRLLELFDRNSLAELQVEEDGVKVTLRRDVPVMPSAASLTTPVELFPTPTAGESPEAPAAEAETPSIPSNAVEIKSPMTGIFYTAPSPGAEPFIQVGDIIEVGQPIGLIEAMKVFSEVPADHSGRVLAVSARNGELVREGDTLVLVES